MESNKKDLVSFGNYLLSDTRTELVNQHPHFKNRPELLEERLKTVSAADLANWKSENNNQNENESNS